MATLQGVNLISWFGHAVESCLDVFTITYTHIQKRNHRVLLVVLMLSILNCNISNISF